jgi:hypothetical protein
MPLAKPLILLMKSMEDYTRIPLQGIIWALTTPAAWHKNMQSVTSNMTDLDGGSPLIRGE